MTEHALSQRLRQVIREELPLPAKGATSERFLKLWKIGAEDLSLAKLAEAHFDAVSILAEAGRSPLPDSVYGVWASEKPDQPLELHKTATGFTINGSKGFCSGIGYVDCVLLTVDQHLIEIDLRQQTQCYTTELSTWSTDAFRVTNTGSITFNKYPCTQTADICEPGWYTRRIGFWHGACGPAACWAGGAEGLVRFAENSNRKDPHTLAHLGALRSSLWAMKAIFSLAAQEIDANKNDYQEAMVRALQVRHLVEQHCTDIIRRLVRGYGPHPLAIDEDTALRYHELDLFLRQSHAERDLEVIGRQTTRPL
jgi:hypothetical protein